MIENESVSLDIEASKETILEAKRASLTQSLVVINNLQHPKLLNSS